LPGREMRGNAGAIDKGQPLIEVSPNPPLIPVALMSLTPILVDSDHQRLAPSLTARRCAALRRELTSPDLSFLMEAHDGLSAKLVEEAGFPAIWASGLAIS